MQAHPHHVLGAAAIFFKANHRPLVMAMTVIKKSKLDNVANKTRLGAIARVKQSKEKFCQLHQLARSRVALANQRFPGRPMQTGGRISLT
jgi:hypothetical protein